MVQNKFILLINNILYESLKCEDVRYQRDWPAEAHGSNRFPDEDAGQN